MRYKVEFDSDTARWLVIDTALANQRMGIHVSKLAALRQVVIEEKRWLTYDPLCSGIPPWEAPALPDAELPSRRSRLRLWARRPRRAERLSSRCCGGVSDLEGTPIPGVLAGGTR